MRLLLLPLLLLSLHSNTSAQTNFTPPNTDKRIAAIGQTRYLVAEQQAAFRESTVFKAKTAPKGADWLGMHQEPGQTFDQFLMTRRNRFQAPRQVIYIQPIGAFKEREREVLNLVHAYAKIYFQAEVKLQEPVLLTKGITSRPNPVYGRQFLSTDVLKWLQREMPRDAYARIAVTMTDLYPKAEWNFVFGQASLQNRVGVYSFARYGDPEGQQFLRRCMQVFAHETGHMFAFFHCIHYQCVMNGSNHLGESDRTPLHLCPICLRKLHTANDFPLLQRYRQLETFYRKIELEPELQWIQKRIRSMGGY
ncbi:MAG: archaemetzincin [Verrucomicrobiota bacterium]